MHHTEFPIPSFIEVFRVSFREFPGVWAATAASYRPSRAGELPKQNMTKPLERWDGMGHSVYILTFETSHSYN